MIKIRSPVKIQNNLPDTMQLQSFELAASPRYTGAPSLVKVITTF